MRRRRVRGPHFPFRPCGKGIYSWRVRIRDYVPYGPHWRYMELVVWVKGFNQLAMGDCQGEVRYTWKWSIPHDIPPMQATAGDGAQRSRFTVCSRHSLM